MSIDHNRTNLTSAADTMLSSFDRPRYVKTAEKEEEPPKAVTDEEVPAASEHREEASVSSATARPMDVD